MSGLDTSQIITDEASQHAEELHVHSRPHADISGRSPMDENPAQESTDAESTDAESTDAESTDAESTGENPA
jgi:hypothetical protein